MIYMCIFFKGGFMSGKSRDFVSVDISALHVMGKFLDNSGSVIDQQAHRSVQQYRDMLGVLTGSAHQVMGEIIDEHMSDSKKIVARLMENMHGISVYVKTVQNADSGDK